MHFALHHLIEFLLAGELFAEFRLRLLQSLRSHSPLLPQRILIQQLLEDDHFEGALAHLGLHIFWKAVVNLRVRKDRFDLAHQIAIRQNGSIYPRDRIA